MTTRFSRLSRVFVFTVASALLAACGDGGSGQGTGMLQLSITDAPVDVADEVVVQFAGVELKPRGGRAFSIDFVDPAATPPNTKTLDLLDYQGTASALLLPATEIPAGEYEWIRLKVNADPSVEDSYISIDGSRCELRIPSGAETGLKLVSGFTVGVGATMAFTIDFDLRKSVVQPPGQSADTPMCDGQAYLLKPALRVVNNLEVGTITGTIAPEVLTAAACPANQLGKVYLFGPYDATAPVPDDFDLNAADGADALTSAMVEVDQNSDNRYTIGFVPVGKYVVAYTCAAADDPAVDADLANTPAGADEVVTFIPEAGVTTSVVANQTTTVPEITVPAP